MRTEGVIVESILGEGVALDDYARQLQENEVKRRDAEVKQAAALASRAELINSITENEEDSKSKILAKLTCPCGAPEKEETE
jgi:hypothetical protein